MNNSKHVSRFVKSLHDVTKNAFNEPPKGVFGSTAKIMCNGVTIKSSELDLEFQIPFDDDMQPNEAEIIVYNLTDSTIAQFKKKAKISIEAGYTGDTGVVFNGYVSKVHSKFEGADKKTTIKALDDVTEKKINSKAFSKGTKASYILKYLINQTKTPIAVFKVRRDKTFTDAVTVEGDLMENIKKYADICGISVFVSKGKVYSRYIKDGDNLNFTLSEDTGLIGSPELFEEEQTIDDITETVKGVKGESLLQHRMAAASIVKIKSLTVNGTYRVRKGKHIFNPDEAKTEFEAIS